MFSFTSNDEWRTKGQQNERPIHFGIHWKVFWAELHPIGFCGVQMKTLIAVDLIETNWTVLVSLPSDQREDQQVTKTPPHNSLDDYYSMDPFPPHQNP